MITEAEIVAILREAKHHPDMRADDSVALEHLKKCPSAEAVWIAYAAGFSAGRRSSE